jgi:aminoglycoside phosphotransferase (APT) family kinase protein
VTSVSADPLNGVFDHGWLAAVLPADARRFRVADSSLAAVLADAGGELVDAGPDVDIAPAAELSGDAPLAVVSFAAPPHDSSSLLVRVARRVISAARVRARALRARRIVRSKGYASPEIVLWDVRQRFRLPEGAREARNAVELLPQRALVLGGRAGAPTLLDASLEAAGATLQEPPSIRAGLVAAMTDRGLLRVAVGPARRQLETQLQALDALRGANVGPAIADRTPWVLAHGKAGLADWSLERRLRGQRPAGGLTDGLRAECLDFLVELHAADGTAPPRSPRADAQTIADVRPEAEARELVALGIRLEETLAGVPRGFGHGDFFLGNLLVEADRLTGVVDWDSGGPGRLPLLDLIHLLHLAQYPLGDEDWGPSLVEHLFRSVRAGGDAAVREYCTRIGVDPGAGLLDALAAAYWLDRVAYILRTHRQRRTEPRWLARNVDHVLHSIQSGDWA